MGQWELKLHTRTHTGKKTFPCDKCSYRATACYNLQKHIQRRHENVNKIDGRRNNGRKKKEVKTEEEKWAMVIFFLRLIMKRNMTSQIAFCRECFITNLANPMT
jgi:uncharacterized Zn-finger protein